jgi:hypothetical protein
MPVSDREAEFPVVPAVPKSRYCLSFLGTLPRSDSSLGSVFQFRNTDSTLIDTNKKKTHILLRKVRWAYAPGIVFSPG